MATVKIPPAGFATNVHRRALPVRKPKTKTQTNPSPPPQLSPVAPVAPQTPPTPPGYVSPETISQYYQAYGKLLQGIPGQIGSAYSDAAKEIAGLGGGFSQGARERLASSAQEAAQATSRQAGSEFAGGIEPSYNATPVADLGYALGSYFPSSSLEAQGAAFKSGAALLPEKAYGEGLYALLAAKNKLASYGYMTPYQQAQLARQSRTEARQNRLDKIRQQQSDRQFKLAVLKFQSGQQLTPYEIESLQFRNRDYAFKVQQAQDRRAQIEATGQAIDIGKSKQAGVIILKDGTIVRDAHRRTIKFSTLFPNAPSTLPKLPSITQSTALANQIQTWKTGVITKTDASSGQVVRLPVKPLTYSQVISRLVSVYHMSRQKASGLANQYFAKGETDRPIYDTSDVKSFLKLGVPRPFVEQALRGNQTNQQVIKQWVDQGSHLSVDDIKILVEHFPNDYHNIIVLARKDPKLAFKLYYQLQTAWG